LRVVIFERASGDERFDFNNLIEFITGKERVKAGQSYLPRKQEFCACRTRASCAYCIRRGAAHGQEIIRFRRRIHRLPIGSSYTSTDTAETSYEY